MALASVDDVKRALGHPVADDEALSHYLETADSYVRPLLQSYDVSGVQSEWYYNVRGTESVRLPLRRAAVPTVRVYELHDSAPRVLGPSEYYVTDDRVVLVLGSDELEKVEVQWSSAGIAVPAAVRDAVALTAAALYRRFPKLSSGMRSERIGSYSYTLNDKDVERVMPPMARDLIRPYRSRASTVSTT